MAAVIKRETPTQTRPFSLADVQARADQILRDAALRAEEIIRQAHLDAQEQLASAHRDAVLRGRDEGRKVGYDAALAEARKSALDQAREKLDSLANALADTLAGFSSQKSSLLAAAESGVIEIALAIAARVCHSLSVNPAVAAHNARRAVAMIGHEHDAEICVHPDDFAALQDCLPSLFADAALSAHGRLRSDPAVTRGGCVLRSRYGTIDASIHEQLDRIALAILAEHESVLPPTPAPPSATTAITPATASDSAPSGFISDAPSRFVALHSHSPAPDSPDCPRVPSADAVPPLETQSTSLNAPAGANVAIHPTDNNT